MNDAARDRAAAMAARVDRTAARAGVGEEDRRAIGRALEAALDHRGRILGDAHHPDFMHPARTALILLEDVGETAPSALLAAVLVETRDPRLAPPPREVEAAGGDVARLLADVPGPEVAGDRVLEALLSTPEDACRVALADRLDLARHLHLRAREEWPAAHSVTCSAYAPLADRVAPGLSRRFAWWCRTFERRYLRD